MVCLDIRQHFHWRDASDSIRYAIVEPGCMLNSKAPQCNIVDTTLCPMERDMQHERAGHPHNGLNRTLSLGILVLSSYTRKCLLLVLFLAIILELIRSENSVLTVDVLDFDKGSVSQPILEGLFGNESITCSKCDLVLNPNNASAASLKIVPP